MDTMLNTLLFDDFVEKKQVGDKQRFFWSIAAQ